MPEEPLSVGVLLHSSSIPAWQYCLVKELLATDLVYVKSVLFTTESVPASGLANSVYRSSLDLLTRYEQRRAPLQYDAFAATPITELEKLPGPSRPELRLINDMNGSALDPVRFFHEQKHDIILALDQIASLNDLARLSNYGVWYFSHDFGQTQVPSGQFVGLAEVLLQRPTIRSALSIRDSASSSSLVAFETFSCARSNAFLISRNEHFWKLAKVIPRMLQQFTQSKSHAFIGNSRPNIQNDNISDPLTTSALSSLFLILAVLRYLGRSLLAKTIRRFFTDRWILMISTDRQSFDFSKFDKLLPPSGWFWADPFVVPDDDKTYLIFEEAALTTGKGHISVAELQSGKRAVRPRRILERPYHLSYPFVFRLDGDLFMIPESAENHTIDLYRFARFPDELEFVRTLAEDIEAYDATLIEVRDLWWMFVNVRSHPGASTWDELCLFYAEHPITGTWRPHDRNPVLSDVRSARPAGNLFFQDGNLYRPSQNSSFRYGYGLNLSRIVHLSKDAYSEEIVSRIEPTWSRCIRGMHTLNRDTRISVIDALYRTRR